MAWIDDAIDEAQEELTQKYNEFERDIIRSVMEIYEKHRPADSEPSPDPDPVPSTDFRVFHDINYKNRPDLEATYGMEEIKLWYESAFFSDKARPGDGNLTLPANDKVVSAARNAPDVSVIDIERWWTGNGAPLVDQAITNYEWVAELYKEQLPAGHKFGFYSTIPIRNYWAVVNNSDTAWKNANSKLEGLGAIVDFTFPSIYTFYDGRDGWVKYATAQIQEAQRVAPGKPCYPFLWPEYHPGKGPIEKDYFRLQLDLCRELADGVIIWTLSSTKNTDWSDIPDWWEAVEEFMLIDE